MIALLAMLVTPTRSTQHECKDPNKTEIIYQGDGEGLPEIYDTLVACPNITSLDLDMTLTGCVVGPEPWHFQFEEGDRFPMLQKLSL